MATLDFTPLFRSSIGFDQIAGLLSHALERPEATYPPYNIEKIGDDQYRVVMALAGFRTWGLDWRSHAVPPTATPAELAGLAAWTPEVFTADASWAAAFARTHDRAPVWLAGFSYGAGVAYRLAAARDAGLAGLVVLDGAAPASRDLGPGDVAIDVGSSRLPWDARERLLATVDG